MSNSQPLAGSNALQLGKYRLIIELAQGGMGYVYLAVAQGPAGFNKLAVIKELKPSLLEEQGFLEMFLDEARLSARLSHPNVVQTNEVGVEDGRAFLAMEYLDGQSLNRVRSRLSKTRSLPLGADVRIVAYACAGLHYAHELRDFDGHPLGVVHRDVSPHNIFVTYDGQVKIVDFGVAKALSSNHESTVGVLKGKVPYMAPEQVTGHGMDRRADIYALGVILWEALAGKRIWGTTRTETIIARVMSGDIPRLRESVPDADPRLVAIIERAMAYRVDDRYPTAAALQHDLEQWLATREDGDYRSVAGIGAEMTRAFATERAQVSASVNEQLRLLATSVDREAPPSVGLVRLPFAGTGSHGSLSGTAALQHLSGVPGAPGSGPSLPPIVMHASGSGSHSGLTPSVAERIVDYSSNATISMNVAAASRPPIVSAAPQPKTSGAAAAVLSVLVVLVVGAGLVAFVLTRPKPTTGLVSTGASAQVATGATGGAIPQEGSPSAATAATDAQSDTVGPLVPASVELTVHVTPSNARVFIDNAALPKGTVKSTFKKDALSHRVRVEAPGYVAKTELVAFDASSELTVQLERVGVVAATPPPPPHRPATNTAPVDPPPKPDLPPKPGRPQRPIDTDLDPK